MAYKKFSKKDRKEYKQAQKQKVLNILSDGVKNLSNSDSWKKYLKYQSSFWNYSFGNCMLIMSQCPEASKVSGHRAWKSLGRKIIKGQKAIWIQAPMFIKNKEAEKDPFVFFKLVPVFDVSQTEGEELPSGFCMQLTGTSEEITSLFEQVKTNIESDGPKVHVEEYEGSSNGYYDRLSKKIVIKDSLEGLQKLTTLVHEYAHHILHGKVDSSRGREEVEAESTAFCVMNALGYETGDYSFGYVAGWSKGDYKKIESCGKNIQTATKRILTELNVEG